MMRHRSPRKEFNTLRADVERLSSDVGNLNESLHHLASNQAHRVRDTVRGDMRQGADYVYRGMQHAKTRGLQARDTVGETLGDRPFTTTAAAFGLGCLVATLIGAARRAQQRRLEGQPHRVSEDDLDSM